MALEVIGGIASIAQLAGTVYTISKTLYEVGEALSNAPSDIKDLARDLETFSDELHLLSTLLHGKDGRYADQVYRLTAKIIGDCATICTKIDRIIRKLRSGSVWAKVKWLYKEKEIMKLLARLRDLKLSLMGTLSVLSALRADHMMDSLGIQNSSLIGGQSGHGLSVETRKQVEDTRLKLAGLTTKDVTKSCPVSTSMQPSSVSLLSISSSSALSSLSTSTTNVGSATSTTPSTTSFAASPFISMMAVPANMPMMNPKALESVDSFHSALSYQMPGSLRPAKQARTPSNPSSDIVMVSHMQGGPPPIRAVNRPPDDISSPLNEWRNEMVLSAVKHFNMERADAEEWAMRLPIPSSLSAAPTNIGSIDSAVILPDPIVEDKPQNVKIDDHEDLDLEAELEAELLADIDNDEDDEEALMEEWDEVASQMDYAGGLPDLQCDMDYPGEFEAAMGFAGFNRPTASDRSDDAEKSPLKDSEDLLLQGSSDLHEVNHSPSRAKLQDNIQDELFHGPSSIHEEDSETFSDFSMRSDIARAKDMDYYGRSDERHNSYNEVQMGDNISSGASTPIYGMDYNNVDALAKTRKRKSSKISHFMDESSTIEVWSPVDNQEGQKSVPVSFGISDSEIKPFQRALASAPPIVDIQHARPLLASSHIRDTTSQRLSESVAAKFSVAKQSNKIEDTPLSEIADQEERRRVQNRKAQVLFRKKIRRDKEHQGRDLANREHAGQSYHTANPNDIGDACGSPWKKVGLPQLSIPGDESLDTESGYYDIEYNNTGTKYYEYNRDERMHEETESETHIAPDPDVLFGAAPGIDSDLQSRRHSSPFELPNLYQIAMGKMPERLPQQESQNSPSRFIHNMNTAPSPLPNKDASQKHDLPDYEIQLKLLEAQNRKRLEMAKQEQQLLNSQPANMNFSYNSERAPPMFSAPVLEVAYQDHQTQLDQLDQQNKKRLMVVGQEQQNENMRVAPNNRYPQSRLGRPGSLSPYNSGAQMASGDLRNSPHETIMEAYEPPYTPPTAPDINVEFAPGPPQNTFNSSGSTLEQNVPSKPVGVTRPPGARGQAAPVHFKREDEGGSTIFVDSSKLNMGTVDIDRSSSLTSTGSPSTDNDPIVSNNSQPDPSGLSGSTTSIAPVVGGLFVWTSEVTTSAPVTGGLFGSAPAQSGNGGLFGSAPAQSGNGGLFGCAPAQSGNGGLFGNTSTSQSASTGGGIFHRSKSTILADPPHSGITVHGDVMKSIVASSIKSTPISFGKSNLTSSPSSFGTSKTSTQTILPTDSTSSSSHNFRYAYIPSSDEMSFSDDISQQPIAQQLQQSLNQQQALQQQALQQQQQQQIHSTKHQYFDPSAPSVDQKLNLFDHNKHIDSTKPAINVIKPDTGLEVRYARSEVSKQSKSDNTDPPSSSHQPPTHQLQQVQMEPQVLQQSHLRSGQSNDSPLIPIRPVRPAPPKRKEKRVGSRGWGRPRQSDHQDPQETCEVISLDSENRDSSQILDGLWLRALKNVQFMEAIIYDSLQEYLDRAHVFTTLEGISNPRPINPDWSSAPYKEKITELLETLPHATSSIKRILEIIGVMEETIGLKIGAIAWACLLGAVEYILSPDSKLPADSQTKAIIELAEIASIIARYTVMENIYAQWKGMSLNEDYEQSLINLSTHVLIYLGALILPPIESDGNTDMKSYFNNIIEADAACRGFTVIVSSENIPAEQKRSIEDISDDTGSSDDSVGTILGDDGNGEVQDMPSPAKRIKT